MIKDDPVALRYPDDIKHKHMYIYICMYIYMYIYIHIINR